MNHRNFKKVIFITLALILSVSTYAKKTDASVKSSFVGKWKQYPYEIGQIPKDDSIVKSTKFLEFNLDQTFSYKDENPKNIISQQGSWEIDEEKKTISFIKDGNEKGVTYDIIKYNKSEFVIKSKDRTFLYFSVTNKVSKFDRFRGIIGILFLVFLAFLFSNNKKRIDWRIPASGILIQLVIAFAVLKVNFIEKIFDGIGKFFTELLGFSLDGAGFLFNNLMDKTTYGTIFAFHILPTVVFFSAITSLLYYFGILQKIVWVFAFIMRKVMRLSGAESLSAAANVFIGQTEAPLVVKPYLDKMTKSEIMALMTGGMATIAGGVLAAYMGFLGGDDPVQQALFAKHLLTASIMNAPAALFVAKILYPQTEEINKDLTISKEVVGSNVLDAIAKGTTDGLKLAVNVGAMLLVFTALIYMVNYMFVNWIGQPTGLNDYIESVSGGRYEGLTLQYILGMVFAPIAWVIGVPSQDIVSIGQLLGEKIILNEFFAFLSLSNLKTSYLITDPKTLVIATYALCGFANFASIGIQIGGIGALSPKQRVTLSQLGIKAVIGGTIATLLTASIAGMIIDYSF